MSIEIGQLRRWSGLPKFAGIVSQPAEGLEFRVQKFMENGDMFGIYEPENQARFTRATVDYTEANSVLVAPASPTEGPATAELCGQAAP